MQTNMQPSQPRLSEFESIELGQPLIDRLQNRFGWKISLVENARLPVPSEKFDAIFRVSLEGISRLRLFYNESYIIEDGFYLHDERNAFSKDNLGGGAADWLKERSKLSANNWDACLMHMRKILEALKRKQVAIDLDESSINQVQIEGSDYNSWMSFERKVDFVKKVDDLILRFFTQLSKISD
jgi:hypothetical protein